MSEGPVATFDSYCPRCDKKFTSTKSSEDSLQQVVEHIKKAQAEDDLHEGLEWFVEGEPS